MRSLHRLMQCTVIPGGSMDRRAASFFVTPRTVIASGPGGCYQSADGKDWTELKLWRENETGAADFLHAYWMGRYYGFIQRE
jgi:hypothetical protein